MGVSVSISQNMIVLSPEPVIKYYPSLENLTHNIESEWALILEDIHDTGYIYIGHYISYLIMITSSNDIFGL